ncbi:hypothetical protein NQ315_007826, partial [Exocentrus adspersus]
PDSVKAALEKALSTNDVIVTTGGISTGKNDLVMQVLEEDFDAFVHFGRVNMKPGSFTAFATFSYNGKHKMVFALPGDPVSCCVTSLLFMIPALRYMERSKIYKFPVAPVMAMLGKENANKRPEYHGLAVTIDYKKKYSLVGTSTRNQISSRINSLADANGLAIVNTDTEAIFVEQYEVILFDDLIYTDTEAIFVEQYEVILFDDLIS